MGDKQDQGQQAPAETTTKETSTAPAKEVTTSKETTTEKPAAPSDGASAQ